MCQRRPGPRCSNHAQTRLDEARAAKEQAQFGFEAFEAAPAPRRGSVPPDAYALWRETRLGLQVAATQTEKDYRTALREFEATPAGMKALEDAVAVVGADTDEGRAMAERLEDARALRSFQLGELRASRAYEKRLAYMSVGERAAVEQAEAGVAAAEQRVEDAETSLWSALARSQESTADLRAAQDREGAALRTLSEATIVAENARETARTEMMRLYVEAGVSERMAGFYATDTLVAATIHRGAPWQPNRDPELLLRYTPTLKVKPSGPDAERTDRARIAAETDPAYAAALSQWEQAGNSVRAARQNADEARATITRPDQERREIRNALRIAQVEHQEATLGLTRAQDAHRDVQARIGSGLSTQPVTEVRMDSAGDQFKRNPDGTTNTYVYTPPADGFPHGRYVRVAGVTSARGMNEVNALVLDTGATAALHGHYGRHGTGYARETQGGTKVAYIVPAHDEAVPLRTENRADRGFYAFVDSTD